MSDSTKKQNKQTHQPAYQLESTVFFFHNKTTSVGLSAGFNTSRTKLDFATAVSRHSTQAKPVVNLNLFDELGLTISSFNFYI